MKHTIKITLPELVWTVDVEVEPDEDIEGMIVATCTTETSIEPKSCEVVNCSVADLETVIRRNLSQVVVEDKCGTLEGRIEYRFDREETATEQCAREILCRIFKLNI